MITACQTKTLFAGRVSAVYAEPETGGLELTEENVEMVLDDIRPYLMAGLRLLSFWRFQAKAVVAWWTTLQQPPTVFAACACWAKCDFCLY